MDTLDNSQPISEYKQNGIPRVSVRPPWDSPEAQLMEYLESKIMPLSDRLAGISRENVQKLTKDMQRSHWKPSKDCWIPPKPQPHKRGPKPAAKLDKQRVLKEYLECWEDCISTELKRFGITPQGMGVYAPRIGAVMHRVKDGNSLITGYSLNGLNED